MPLEAPTAQKNVVRRTVSFVENTHSSVVRSNSRPVPSHLTKHIKRCWWMKGLRIHMYFGWHTRILSRRPWIRSKVHVSCLAKRSWSSLSILYLRIAKGILHVWCNLRQPLTDRERKVFVWFFDIFWSVSAGQAYGIIQKQNSLFQRQETPVDQSCQHEWWSLSTVINWQLLGKVENQGWWKRHSPHRTGRGMAQLQLLLKVRAQPEGNKQKQPVNSLEKCKDSVSGVAGVLRASNSSISWGTS